MELLDNIAYLYYLFLWDLFLSHTVSHDEPVPVSATNSLSRDQPYPFSIPGYYSSRSCPHVHSLAPPHDMLLILPNLPLSSLRAVVPLLSLTLEVYSPNLSKPFCQFHQLFATLFPTSPPRCPLGIC